MDSGLKLGKFEVPRGFQEVEGRSALYLEDVEDDDVELWIIQAPEGMDMTKLEDKNINFKGPTTIPCGDNMPNVKCFASECYNNDARGFHLVLPRKSDNKLCNVSKAFNGHIVITECTDLPDFKMPSEYDAFHEKTEQDRSDVDDGFHQNNIEQDSCHVSKKKKKKHKTRVTEKLENVSKINSADISIDCSIQNANVVENEGFKRKHKKSKKRSREVDTSVVKMELCDPEESSENFQVPGTEEECRSEKKRKKHKKKEKTLDQMPEPMDFTNVEVKTELDYPDVSENVGFEKKLREESSLIGERKRKKKHKRELKEQEEERVSMSMEVEIKQETDELVGSPSETFINKKAKKKKKKKKKKHEDESRCYATPEDS